MKVSLPSHKKKEQKNCNFLPDCWDCHSPAPWKEVAENPQDASEFSLFHFLLLT